MILRPEISKNFAKPSSLSLPKILTGLSSLYLSLKDKR
jgi:hypothetical protein